MKGANCLLQMALAVIPIFFSESCFSQDERKSNFDNPVAGKLWRLPLPGNKILDMVWIAPGNFIMGSPEAEPGRKGDEGPQTKVKLKTGYWLGKTEVTIGQWKAVTGISLRDQVIKMLSDETLYDFGGQKQKLRDYMHFDRDNPDRILANADDGLPMYFVSWNDAIEFCRSLTLRERENGRLPEGYEYTLPTEGQWEYACRAETTTATFAGPLNAQEKNASVLENICWYSGNSAKGYEGKGLGNLAAGPRNTGEKLPNAWGLYDMLGNVWEWCRDWWAPYRGGSVTDPIGPDTGTHRVNRGGSWGSGPNDERSANRASNPPAEKSAYRGFRLALCAAQ